MRNLMYALVTTCFISGGIIYATGHPAAKIAHYLAGLTLLAVLTLFTLDHLHVYKRKMWKFSYAFITGAIMIICSAIVLFSGLYVFAYESGEAPEALLVHGYFALAFLTILILHLLKSTKIFRKLYKKHHFDEKTNN